MNRSPIQRRTPLRATAPAKAETPVANARCKAKGCSNRFVKRSMAHRACSFECSKVVVAQDNEAKAKTAAKEDRKQTRAQKEAMKTVPTLKKEAQKAFNAWVQRRDAKQNCISCAAPPPDLSGLHAGRDAGHYRSTGAADHLRFHEDNCHAQCVSCNQHKAGNVVAYRFGLIARIGLPRVEALGAHNTLTKWTRDGLRTIRDEYRAKAREMGKTA